MAQKFRKSWKEAKVPHILLKTCEPVASLTYYFFSNPDLYFLLNKLKINKAQRVFLILP